MMTVALALSRTTSRIACGVVLLQTLVLQRPDHGQVMGAFEFSSTSQPLKKSSTFRVAPREYAVVSEPFTESFHTKITSRSSQDAIPPFERRKLGSTTTTAPPTQNRSKAESNRNPQETTIEMTFDKRKRSKSLKETMVHEISIKNGCSGRSSGRSSKGMALPFDSALTALRNYHSLHGNLVLPQKFIVPENCGYPKLWHGVDLAGTVYNMEWWQTHVKQRPTRVAELNQLGFVWERLQPQWNLVLTALITYSSQHGHAKVPAQFIVPHGDTQWPKSTWGIPLGNSVYRIRSRHDFLRGSNAASRRAQLDGLGFVWEVSDSRFRTFLRALKQYVTLQKRVIKSTTATTSTALNPSSGRTSRPRQAIRVPSTFVVPSHDMAWPEDLWNYPLGAKCVAVRQKELYIKNNPERLQALIELGFHSNGNAHLGWLDVVHAAAIYSRLNRNKVNVPCNFVVPAPGEKDARTLTISMNDEDDWPWPERLWGLPLGQRLKDIRVKRAYLKGPTAVARRAQLDALGFEWTPKRGRRW